MSKCEKTQAFSKSHISKVSTVFLVLLSFHNELFLDGYQVFIVHVNALNEKQRFLAEPRHVWSARSSPRTDGLSLFLFSLLFFSLTSCIFFFSRPLSPLISQRLFSVQLDVLQNVHPSLWFKVPSPHLLAVLEIYAAIILCNIFRYGVKLSNTYVWFQYGMAIDIRA